MCFSVQPLALFNIGPTELILILLIVLLLFGGKRLPDLAKGLGQSIREFKKATNEDADSKPAETDAAKSADSKKTNGTPAHGAN
jgi:sec-independent protein translocase protein TatA